MDREENPIRVMFTGIAATLLFAGLVLLCTGWWRVEVGREWLAKEPFRWAADSMLISTLIFAGLIATDDGGKKDG